MKKVMTFGTFDIFHEGHRSYLSQAKKLGEYLIVVVARDETVLKVKGREARNGENERLEVLKNSNLVDEAVLGNLVDRYAVIEKHRPDVIAIGYDQKVDNRELKNKLQEFGLQSEIVKLKSFQPEVYKSSKMKNVNRNPFTRPYKEGLCAEDIIKSNKIKNI